MPVSTSHGIVPASPPISSDVTVLVPSGPCCVPSTTTSSRIVTPAMSVASTVNAGESVGVTNGNCGDAPRPRSFPPGAVARRVAGKDVAKGNDFRSHAHHRAQVVARAGARCDAEQRDPWARQIVASARKTHERSAVGRMGNVNRKAAPDRFEMRQVVDDRRKIARNHLAPALSVVAPHDDDGRADAGLAQLDRFFEQSDADAVDARTLQSARDRWGAMAVAVRLQHPEDPSSSCKPA